MKRLIIALALLACMGADVSAQGFLNRLKDRALQTVQGKVEDKVDQTVSDQMDEVLDGKSSKKEKKTNDAEMVDVGDAGDAGGYGDGTYFSFLTTTDASRVSATRSSDGAAADSDSSTTIT